MSKETPPVLAVTEGWVLDELAQVRLRLQLERAGADVVGIAASPAALDPGESYVNRAARAARDPLDPLVPAAAGPIGGAVLLRAGTAHEVDDDGVTVADGQGAVLVDTGAHVHDPWRPADPAPVGPDVRPPFPHRAVVLLVGADADLDIADWARGMANDLLRHGVDARLALAEPTEGLHLSRPCLPDADALHAIAPHVVVPLDDETSDALEGWWGDDRTTLVVDYEPDMVVGAEPISWRLGVAQGRRRGRVGPAASGADLARLVDRLCGGPHPLPPRDRSDRPIGLDLRSGVTAVVSSIRSRRATAAEPTRGRRVLLVHGDQQVDPWLDGLLDAVEAGGNDVRRRSVDGAGGREAPDEVARRDDIVVLADVALTDELLAAVEGRRAEGRPTVVAAGRRAVAADGVSLVPEVDRLVGTCHQAITGSPAVAEAIDRRAGEHLLVPPLLGSHRLAELRSLRANPREIADGPRTVGWQIDDGAAVEEVEAITGALAAVLGEEPEAELVLVMAAGTAAPPPELARRATIVEERPGEWIVNGWTAQIWTTSHDEHARTGDVSPLVEASALAVPTLLAGGHPALASVAHPRSLRVRPADDPERWTTMLRPLVTDVGARARRAVEVVKVVDALFGPASAMSVAERFLGWVEALHDGELASIEVARA